MGYEYEIVDDAVRIVRCAERGSSLVVPARIDGLPVTAIAPYAFEGNRDARSIECPATVADIGSRAFANCTALERIAFPAELDRYDSSWVVGCARLEEIVLPGSVADLDLPSPAPPGVRRIVIGPQTRAVNLSRSWKTRLDQVSVHPDSRWLSADGSCVYTADGTVLLAHATRTPSVSVAPGCRRVAEGAFEGESHLERVALPEGLEEIGERAFAESALRSFEAPGSMRSVGAEAFAGCKALSIVKLAEGLSEIGERAFAECASCEGVRIPASVVHLGRKAFEGSGLSPSGDNPTLTVDERNPKLFIDDAGVLCVRGAEGVVVREAYSPQIARYRTPVGTVRIARRAFRAHPGLEVLEVGGGVEEIGEEAFMGCECLRSANLPAGLRRLGDRAFATTGLRSCDVPASVEFLGECALAFNYKNWHPTTNPPEARAHVTFEPGNARYFVESGLLYERCAEGSVQVMLYIGPNIDLAISRDARNIAPYAFFGVQGIRELRLPAGIRTGEATFAMRKPPERIVLEGDGGISLETMHDWRGVCALQRAFADGGMTSAQLLCATFDEEALGAQPDYEVFRYMVTRLARPSHLLPETRRAFELVLLERLGEVCVEFGRHDARRQIDQLVDVGLINRETITEAIEAASAANSAAVMARLHALKRGFFRDDEDDYSL